MNLTESQFLAFLDAHAAKAVALDGAKRALSAMPHNQHALSVVDQLRDGLHDIQSFLHGAFTDALANLTPPEASP